jgi:hypothetical protein
VISVVSGGVSGTVSILTNVSTATSANNFIVPTPFISSFSPGSGVPGAKVIISGTNFTGVTTVKFNGVTATITSSIATQLKVIVPNGATSGPISITNAFGTTTTKNRFLVQTIPALPTISSFSPTSAVVGAQVTITGTNLSSVTAVSFGGVSTSSLISKSNTQFVLLVPVGAGSGPITVTSSQGNGASFTRQDLSLSLPSFAGVTFMTVGDLDSDGDLDLATSNTDSKDVSILKNNGNGTFAAPTNFTVGGH